MGGVGGVELVGVVMSMGMAGSVGSVEVGSGMGCDCSMLATAALSTAAIASVTTAAAAD